MNRRGNVVAWILTPLFLMETVRQVLAARSWGHDSFQMTECLINYAGGFVRRGLFGEIISRASGMSGIAANLLVIGTTLAAFVLLTAWFLRRASAVHPPALLISCVVMGIPAYQDSIVRKDCLGLLALLGCLRLMRSGLPRPLAITGVNLLAGSAMLCHEAFAFYGLAPLAFLRHRDDPDSGWKAFLLRCLALCPSAGCFCLAALSHGSPQVAQAVNDSWMPLWQSLPTGETPVTEPAAAIGAIGWTVDEGLGPGLNLLTSGLYQPTVWAALFAISFALLTWCVRETDDWNSARTGIASLLLVQLVFIAPLFVLGHDYGRWLFFWSASAIMLRTCGWTAPAFIVGRASGLMKRWRAAMPLHRHGAAEWVLLAFGIPVCWNLAAFTIASPLARLISVFAGRS